ncbi:PPOX class F420-dependent oxidoreductase [Mycobacterium sp. PS03-16]|uniref:PPOX class F420-dependent oxidoreductase n=1 Tax=Mycobacterium sp. PS03-16 TaxID=2559611 RepID=UPI0010739846|nr:PPOX class F420-dependent oxidoreductase [Mycobacterium sp. PS03-16]TFV60703.1 PPOX class F420-dependent oxidoreductase [Mycobacterium sp. PS03-16]
MDTLTELDRSRYAQLRSYRRDGTPVDTPIWFHLDGTTLVFRTKRGPKTARVTRDPRVEVRVCDHRGRVRDDAPTLTGRAVVLAGRDAEDANRALHRRYGWQYNILPLLRIPGVRNVHSGLSWREKWRKAHDCGVWDDSAIVRVDL